MDSNVWNIMRPFACLIHLGRILRISSLNATKSIIISSRRMCLVVWEGSGVRDNVISAVLYLFRTSETDRVSALHSRWYSTTVTCIRFSTHVCFLHWEKKIHFPFYPSNQIILHLLVLISWLAHLVVLINPLHTSCVIVLLPAPGSI